MSDAVGGGLPPGRDGAGPSRFRSICRTTFAGRKVSGSIPIGEASMS
jgi:hypothetical protein